LNFNVLKTKTNKNMRKFASLLTVLMLLCTVAFAQTRTVKGIIRDDKGEPIPFATVSEAGTKNATTADADGAFLIKIRDGAKLTVTATGFNSTTATPGEGDLAVELTKKAGDLQEVVVTTALGVRKQPRELGYSTAKVTNKEFTQANAVNVQNGLTGKVSGLNVATTNNGVFSDTRITLRGIRSLTGNNQPLLVLDGSPVALGQLNNLNPNDIEDITILKGASAAALYGPDGVNGVIFVKTKRGTRSGAPMVQVSHATQFESVLFLPDFQKQFGSGSSVNPVTGVGVYDPIENQQYGDPYDGTMRPIGKELPDGSIVTVPYSYKKNGRRNFFETGVTLQNAISYSARDFYLSAQDVDIKGTLDGDKNRRTTFRFNAGKEYGRLKANFNVAYTRGQYEVAGVSPYWEVFNTPGHIDLGVYKDWRNDVKASPNHYFNEYYQNPYFIKDRSRNRGNSDDIFAQTELVFRANSWLTLTYRASTTMVSSDFKNTTEAFTFSDYAKNVTHKYNASNDLFASVSDGTSRSNRITSDFFITGQKTFGDFSVDGLLGHSYRQTTAKGISVSGGNLVIPTLYNLSSKTGEPGAAESNSKTRLIGAFGKVAVGYKNWAFLEFTGRNDWDSRLPQGALSFFYPGGSASIVLSDAVAAIKNSNVISYLKLRGSVSKSGNVNLGVYSLEATYAVAGGFPYGSLPGYTGSSVVNNPAIKPEFVVSKEAGFELSLFKNRVNLEVTGYLQDNSNQILDIQVSRATGFTQAKVNAADFENKGLEFDLRLTPALDLGDFRIDLKANLSLLDSKVNSVYQGLDEIGIGNGNFAIVGQPAFMFKLTDYRRDSLGRIIVDRVTGYPALDPNIKMFGRTMPKTIIGINPTFSWKNLALSVTADYRGGHQVYHGIGPDMDFTGSSARSGSNSRQRFIVPNSVYDDGTGKYVVNTDVAVANGGYGFYEATNTNRGVNSNYISSAAAWKIREIALSYDLPTNLLNKTKVIKGATIALTARNMFTFLPESNQWTDPEFANTTGNAMGVNNNSILPPNRIYGFNVNLTF
jgi:TonB-linked SusC/RagA family outer membrane protein